MSKVTFISRFSLIVKRLKRGPATFEQIAEYLQDESDIKDRNFNISIRTLQRDIKDIYEQLGIEIVNERKGDKRYFIKELPEDQGESERILEAYDMLNIVKASKENSKYIFFEPRKPTGLNLFNSLLHACANKKIVNFKHHKYWDDSETSRTVHPLALKESRGRWYLVAVDTKDEVLKTFGLDRIGELYISATSFRNKYAFNMEEVFKFSFGIINDGKPEKIVLSVTKETGQYLKNYPLHSSQVLVSESKEEVVLQLNLLITVDLVMELMSFGENVTVVQPKRLGKQLVEKAKRIISNYNKE